MPAIFTATANQMLLLFILIISGFLLNKLNLLDHHAGTILAKLESYVILPVMVFGVFSSKFSVGVILDKCSFFLSGVVIVSVAFGMALLLSRFFSKDPLTRKIYIYSFTVANFGFMGYAVVGSVFGENALFNMMIFCLPLNLFVYSVGMALLIPSERKISVKTLLNPIFISMILGAAVGVISVPLPLFLVNTISSVSACMAPVAMILTGFIIGNYRVKQLLTHPRIYVASALRLVGIPLVFIACMKAIGIGTELVTIALSALAMPLGLNTVVFPAAYGGDTTTGASMALISHVLSVITIPLMFSLLL